MLLRHFADPSVALDAHEFSRFRVADRSFEKAEQGAFPRVERGKIDG